MIIIVIEGLSLVGKTTLCKNLLQYYEESGKICRFCRHGHLTTNTKAISYYNQAIKAYNSWQLQNAIELSINSIQADYFDFCSNDILKQHVDIIFLDRHFISQYVVAEHFNINIPVTFYKPENYFEFLLTANYAELLRRASIRKNNHSKLTDYTLSSPHVHKEFEDLYKKHILLNNPPEHVIKNDDFSGFKAIVPLIDKLI